MSQLNKKSLAAYSWSYRTSKVRKSFERERYVWATHRTHLFWNDLTRKVFGRQRKHTKSKFHRETWAVITKEKLVKVSFRFGSLPSMLKNTLWPFFRREAIFSWNISTYSLFGVYSSWISVAIIFLNPRCIKDLLNPKFPSPQIKDVLCTFKSYFRKILSM